MRHLIPTLTLGTLCAALSPLAVQADNYRCVTGGYCTNDLECHPDETIFVIQTDKSGMARFGWDEPDAALFEGEGRRLAHMTVWHQSDGAATQTLVLADNLQATFTVSAYIDTFLYTSLQSLTCVRQ